MQISSIMKIPSCKWLVMTHIKSYQHPTNLINIQIFGPEHLSLKVPNIDFDVSVDSVQWQTATPKSKLRPYNSMQMSIRCKVSMHCSPKIT